MEIREYRPEDCRELAALFYDTVHEVNAADYTNTAGYLDRLYVHKDYQKKGIASALCDRLEENCAAAYFTTHASITARPFFEKRGYRVMKEQQVVRKGVKLTNYVMKKIFD